MLSSYGPKKSIAYPRRYRLGLIEATPTAATSTKTRCIRGFNASASLKHGVCSLSGRGRYRIRGFNASASLKLDEEDVFLVTVFVVSEALMPRPH